MFPFKVAFKIQVLTADDGWTTELGASGVDSLRGCRGNGFPSRAEALEGCRDLWGWGIARKKLRVVPALLRPGDWGRSDTLSHP